MGSAPNSGPPLEIPPKSGQQILPGGGITGLAQTLYAPSFGLQVSPRRRLFISPLTISVPATGNATSQNVLFFEDTLQPNDAVLIEMLAITLIAAATGVALNNVSMGVQGTAGNQPLGQAINTIQNVPFTSPPMLVQQTPSPQLWNSYDLNWWLLQQLTPLTSSEQPLAFSSTVTLSNGTAGAINVTLKFFAFYRFVRGLQEG